MSYVWRLHCDSCHRELEVGHPAVGYWYRLERNNPREFDVAGDSDRIDLCSLPCLRAWAERRELVAVS